MSDQNAYARAGVDIDASNRAVDRIKAITSRVVRPEVLSGVGPFAAMCRIPAGMRDPILVSSTDGVGTKVLIAKMLGFYSMIGHDLVNHCVNDILTSGASPLFFLDYLAGNGLSEDQKVDLVLGMTAACVLADCSLVGGETADMPDLYRHGDYDIAGFIVGVVDRDQMLPGRPVRVGDALLGLRSTGLHTNGYSLVRQIWRIGTDGHPTAGMDALERYEPWLGTTLGAALMKIHRCYLRDIRPVVPSIQAFAHITGGGLIDNLPRVLPPNVAAQLDVNAWGVPALFQLIQYAGLVSDADMYRTFNMGIGGVLVVHPDNITVVESYLPEAVVIGEVIPRVGDGPQVIIPGVEVGP